MLDRVDDVVIVLGLVRVRVVDQAVRRYVPVHAVGPRRAEVPLLGLGRAAVVGQLQAVGGPAKRCLQGCRGKASSLEWIATTSPSPPPAPPPPPASQPNTQVAVGCYGGGGIGSGVALH
mgnify:CR=1 FL=1